MADEQTPVDRPVDRLDRCADCPLVLERRAFLANAAMAAAATLAAIASSPGRAFAATVQAIEPRGVNGAERSYPIPPSDGVSIDVSHGVILARWQGAVYAFSARCPHRGAQLTWRAAEGRVFCPKHKARFRADGMHAGGRSSRHLDRFGIRRRGNTVVVDLAVLYRVDRDPAGWSGASVRLS